MAKVIADREGGLASTTTRGVIGRGWATAREAVRSISKRKRGEEALRESEGRFRSAFEHAVIGMALLAPDSRLLQVNRSFSEMLGYSQEELTSATWRAITHSDDLDMGHNQMRWMLSGEIDSGQFEKRYLHKAGHVIWALLSFTVLRDAHGGPLCFIAQIQDISGRKRAEEALRESEERLGSLMQSASDAIIIADSNGNIVSWNRGAQNMLGHEEREALGEPVTLLMPERYRDPCRSALARLRSTGESRIIGKAVEFEGLRRDGSEFPLELSLASWKAGQETFYSAIIRDITERKRAEEALRESEARLRSTLDGMMEGCQIIGFDWRYLYVNDALAPHGRRAKEELLGHTMMEMYPGIEDTEMFAHLRRCMEQRIPHRLENEFTYPDGDKAWFELSIQPAPEGIFILSMDITGRKRMEEALQKAREELEAKVERQMRRPNPYRLTFRELTVLHLVAAGRSDKEIGLELVISPLTAQKHVSNVLAKMDAASRTEATARALREGLLD